MGPGLRGAVAGVVLTAGLAAAGTADAATFCVGGGPGCADTHPNLQQAFAAAEANNEADQLRIGPGTYDEAAAPGNFSYSKAEPLEIIGDGSCCFDPTILVDSAATAGETLLSLDAMGSQVEISDVGFRPGLNGVNGESGLRLANGASARHVEVLPSFATVSSGITGYLLDGAGSLVDSRALLDEVTDSLGLNVIGAAGVTLRDLEVRADGTGALIGTGSGARSTFTRSFVTVDDGTGIFAQSGSTSLHDLVIRALESGSAGISVSNGNDLLGSFGLDGRHLTIIGPGSAVNSAGASVFAEDAPPGTQTPFLTLRDSIVADFMQPVNCTQEMDNDDVPRLTTDYVDYPPTGSTIDPDCIFVESNRFTVPPGFAGPGADRLGNGSPLIDAGTPGGLDAGEPPRDILDGNDDGIRRRDLGAFERSGGTNAFPSEIVLRYRPKLRALAGEIASPLPGCLGDRLVVVFRKRRGADRFIEEVISAADGKLPLTKRARPGRRYYGVMSMVSYREGDPGSGDACAADRSETVRAKKKR